MGAETTFRTRKAFLDAVRKRAVEILDSSIAFHFTSSREKKPIAAEAADETFQLVLQATFVGSRCEAETQEE